MLAMTIKKARGDNKKGATTSPFVIARHASAEAIPCLSSPLTGGNKVRVIDNFTLFTKSVWWYSNETNVYYGGRND